MIRKRRYPRKEKFLHSEIVISVPLWQSMRRNVTKMSKQYGEEEIQFQQGPKVPFVISLVAGILIMAGGILGLLGVSLIGISLATGISLWALLEVICGIIVFIMAFTLYILPKYAFQLGTLIIVVSVISLFFFGFGFFLIGLLLGVLGGSLAVTWVPSKIYPSSRSCLFEISVECPTRKVDPDISITTLSEKVCPVCPIRIRMGLEGARPVKLASSEPSHTA